MNIDTEDRIFGQLLSLLQSTLFGLAPAESRFAGMDASAWDSLYRRAAKEGVLAIAFEGMLRLPENCHPPRMLKLTWSAGVNNIEQKHAYFTKVANELAALFGEQGIRMLTFKGITLAQYYPVPSHREFGDLDIYLFDKKKEGDRLLRKWNAQENRQTSYKHSVFKYKGVPIENHACFLNIRDSSEIAALNTRLIALAEAIRRNVSDEKLLFPSPDFMALFFMVHAITHFQRQLPALRYFYDWAVFLHANKGKWDMSRYCEALSGTGFRKMAGVFTAIAVDCLGLPPDEAPPFERDNALQEKILTAMFHPLSFPENDKQNIWKILVYKYHRFMDRRWRYNLVNPGAFYYRMILRSIFFHLRNPGKIWKLNK
ncbi:hypothetical protein FACS189420_7800 [Bacteroidia bacterium]|nr:hypothetical protein FACS189420_7800 [Bacteroidia bacterium]